MKRSFLVSVGSVKVPVYALSSGRWCISYYQDGRRRRESRSTRDEAADRAKEVATAIHGQKALGIMLTGADRDSYARSLEVLNPFGVTLHDAVEAYAKARTKLQKASLNEAVDFYLRHHPTALPAKTVKQVADELLEAKRQDGVSAAYLKDLNTRLPHIAAAFSGPMGQVTQGQLENWLRSLPGSLRSRNNYRGLVVTLWRFARQRGYLLRDRATEADMLPRAKDNGTEIEIFRPADLARLIAKADGNLVPFLAIGAFTGLRHAELLRLEWEDVRFDQGFVEVKAKKAKTAQRRLVPIQPNLEAWLAPYRAQTGPVCLWSRIGRKASVLAREIGVRWPKNGLRHSYATYRLAQCQDAAKVALEMGNTPAMIFRHYRELVTPQDAMVWWNISPKQAANVVPMRSHQAAT
ncbi:MAG TPA: tyrosine-type recombinase/integrase [Verrucomicrobiae bacterium]|nr:tyrosine-type recombinase/integrase [Verrucomicrobiae bacterium]